MSLAGWVVVVIVVVEVVKDDVVDGAGHPSIDNPA